MTLTETDVTVMDGDRFVQHGRCSRFAMPDGSQGVLWRGIAYPLLAGDCIDVSALPLPPSSARHAVLAGEEASWVLIQGMRSALDTARRALEQGGVVVSRTGRWLGETVGDTAFDWFLRCDGRLDDQFVGRLLGQSPSVPTESDSAVRLAILEQRIAGLLADVARAEGALRQSLQMPRPTEVAESARQPDPALQRAFAEIQSLHDSLGAMQSDERLKAPPEKQLPAALRTREEVNALLAALRPDITFLRDSLMVALGELQSRSGFYKALGELPQSGSRPEGWKMLRGTERWWECHLSTGRNDHGRLYARYDTITRQWSLLLGWKVDQPQDIAWLKRQG